MKRLLACISAMLLIVSVSFAVGPETPPPSPDVGPETPPPSPLLCTVGPETPPPSPDVGPEAPPPSPWTA
ncbi:hypothetical protein IBX73_11520 [candidate division WOR-3 bacterium]|nr:hypothetical protein [candidate division WOR-3 bacterium]